MFKSFAAALLLSSQFALAEAKSRKGGKGFKAVDRVFASCVLEGNPADPSSASGLFLLDQADADSKIKVKGHVDLGASGEDLRALAITENAFDDADCDLNGDVFNPFTSADSSVTYDSLRDILFDADGIGYYEHRDKLTTLFGENSVIGRSISLYEMEEQSGFIEACCTINEITRAEYRQAMKTLECDHEEGERRLQSDGEDSVDLENSDDSVSDEERRLQSADEDSVDEASVDGDSSANEDSDAEDDRRLQSADESVSEDSVTEDEAQVADDQDEQTSDDEEDQEDEEDDEEDEEDQEDEDEESTTDDEGERRLRGKA